MQSQHSRAASGSKKRAREPDSITTTATTAQLGPSPPSSPGGGGNAHPSTSNFRQVSACNRCRHRKNRCDQVLPQCGGCARARVACVGFDPVSKRTIPRSYVYYLETRVRNLEHLLREQGLEVPLPEQDFPISEEIRPGVNVPFAVQKDGEGELEGGDEVEREVGLGRKGVRDGMVDPALASRTRDEDEKLDRLVTDVGMVSVHGAPESRAVGSTAGISFARVVFAAVRSSVSNLPSSERRHSRVVANKDSTGGGGGTTMRESFFGLHAKPGIKAAPFPDKALGKELVELYFEHANPQIPVLHRGKFMALFERVYAAGVDKRTSRESYLLNMVFAIGSGIIMDSDHHDVSTDEDVEMDADEPTKKRAKFTGKQRQPEEYHASAVVHLESFLGASPTAEGTVSGLEELQAVLLLASLALLRPIAPGLWYIVGVATRLAVDLGLHSEEGNSHLDDRIAYGRSKEGKSLGRKQWTRDLRRRLWWCVYAFDRIVSTCVGRPFGITDRVVTTEFPSLLDDRYITVDGFLRSPHEAELPSYKLIAHHYLRLRLLQSEILQVLQHRQAEQARMLGVNRHNAFMHTNLVSPFLDKFDSFRAWRADLDRRLWEWKETTPRRSDTGVAFTPLFLELNYWQAIITLYRQSLTVPEPLADELSPSTGEDVQSPGRVTQEAKEDEQMVFMKVAQAGQTVLKIYRQLHRLKLISYTFLATHHLFMSGISFLYAIWHSTLVRAQLTLDDVEGTVLTGTSVLTDLIAKCPPAEACRDAFVRMSNATIAMVQKTTGFGSASTLASQPLNSPGGYFDSNSQERSAMPAPRHDATATTAAMMATSAPSSKLPRFDMNLSDLFSDDELRAARPLHSNSRDAPRSSQQQQQQQQRDRNTATATAPHQTPDLDFLQHSSAQRPSATATQQPQPNWNDPWPQLWGSSSDGGGGGGRNHHNGLEGAAAVAAVAAAAPGLLSPSQATAAITGSGGSNANSSAAFHAAASASSLGNHSAMQSPPDNGGGGGGGGDLFDAFNGYDGRGFTGLSSDGGGYFDPGTGGAAFGDVDVWDWDWDASGVDMLGGFFFGGGDGS